MKRAIASILFKGPRRAGVAWVASITTLALVGSGQVLARTDGEPPVSPRELFNAGTKQLRDGKLREAETMLEGTLSAQADWLQPSALYNLGHVRFAQGAAELKKGPPGKASAARGRAAADAAAGAIRAADAALESHEMQQLVASYLHGRGVRRELKAATEVVRRALETHRVALGRWQRSSGDFKSADELKVDDDARANADVVDRCIARLIDSIQQLQQAMQAMGEKNRELGEKLKQLKGSIPDENMPPGAAGEDEEEEEQPKGPEPGMKEAPSRAGEEMLLSPEQAAWLLETYKLDSDRRLPMGDQETAEPRPRNRPTW